jgi:glutaredoxin 3
MSESNESDNVSGIVMYESDWCGFCRAARRLLDSKGWSYESLNVDGNAPLRAKMQEITGRTSVPQIFFGDQHIGGFDDIAALEQDGELDNAFAAI